MIKPNEEQRKEWHRYAEHATAELVEEGEISQAMLDRLNGILAKQRDGQ